MKLIFAIINNDDSITASAALNREGFFVTRLSTTGGFLMVGNTTLMLGVEDCDVPRVKQILKDTCATRKQIPASARESFGRSMNNGSLPDEITVGGATIFVTDVCETDKI